MDWYAFWASRLLKEKLLSWCSPGMGLRASLDEHVFSTAKMRALSRTFKTLFKFYPKIIPPKPNNSWHCAPAHSTRRYHWQDHWNLLSDIYSLSKSVANLTFQNLSLYRKIYFRMYRDLLWYLISLYCVPIYFKKHRNLNIYHSWKSVLQPSLSGICCCKGKSTWECMGTSYGTLSGSIVRPSSFKTIGI